MRLVKDNIELDELKQMARAGFGDMVKSVVDVKKAVMAVDAELHSDLEAFLLGQGSGQESLWGINIYPELTGEEFVEFDSMINIRPSLGNNTRGVEDRQTQKDILKIVKNLVQK